jgi:hypothetical protein
LSPDRIFGKDRTLISEIENQLVEKSGSFVKNPLFTQSDWLDVAITVEHRESVTLLQYARSVICHS